jgi:hypothetical protein
MKEWITIFLAWWAVPITMIGFWLRYIPRHEWWGTIFHIGLIIVSVAFAIFFYRLCALTLQGKQNIDFRLFEFRRHRRFYYKVSVVAVGFLFSLLSYGAINGVHPTFVRPTLLFPVVLPNEKIIYNIIEEVVPWAFDKIGYDVFAYFREKEVSEKPDRYWEIPTNDLPKYVKGANLKGRNLNNADMFDAFLVKADLRYASLNDAYLKKANLQQVNLEGANLQEANLEDANLQKAKLLHTNLKLAVLLGAKLQQADLSYAKLQGTILVQANLQEADLWSANLQKANLGGTILQEANLGEADLSCTKYLTIDQLSKVKTLYNAKLDPDLLKQVKKCCPHLLERPKEETNQKEGTKFE